MSFQPPYIGVIETRNTGANEMRGITKIEIGTGPCGALEVACTISKRLAGNSMVRYHNVEQNNEGDMVTVEVYTADLIMVAACIAPFINE